MLAWLWLGVDWVAGDFMALIVICLVFFGLGLVLVTYAFYTQLKVSVLHHLKGKLEVCLWLAFVVSAWL